MCIWYKYQHIFEDKCKEMIYFDGNRDTFIGSV